MDTNIRITAVISLIALLLVTVTGAPHGIKCHLAKYSSISLSAMEYAWELQRQYEEIKTKKMCSMGLQLKNFTECDIKGSKRLILTIHRVSLAVDVLEYMSKSYPSDLMSRNLETFSVLKEDLLSCETGIKHSDPTSAILLSCKSHLTNYEDIVSTQCLQHGILQNLVWLLVEDLRFLVNGKDNENKIPFPTESAPQIHKNGRKNKKHKHRPAIAS